METNFLENKISELSSIDQEMNMFDMHNEIQALLMKYSSGTDIQNLSVNQFKTISYLINDIMTSPKVYLNEINNIPFNCPDCSADLEWQKDDNSVKFIKHNI